MRKLIFIVLSLLFSQRGYSQELLPVSNGNIVKHSYFSLAYSEDAEQAEWVYYELTPEMISGDAQRKNNFRSDAKVETGSATLADYKNSGYDRGHLCPAASMSINTVAMSESFLMSNMSPQLPAFNRGGWKSLEECVRYWADIEHKIYVVTGPILDNPLAHIGVNEVAVPSAFYKVVYSPHSSKMIGFIMPNARIEHNLSHYAVCVDQIESVTGIDFFASLDEKIERKLEMEIDITLWDFEFRQ